MAALVTIALFALPAFYYKPVADTLLREEFTIGSFRSATRLALSPQGWLYVVDRDENSIVLSPSPREKLRSAGGYGWAATSFDTPSGIATDGLSVYVSDLNNHRIQRYDRNLNYLSSLSTRDSSLAEAQFGFPSGVALSRFGDLLVLDSENRRVLKFTAQGQWGRSFGGIDAKEGRLRQPVKIVVSASDHIYVLEPDRLIEFDYFGNVILIIGEGLLQGAQGFDVANDVVVVATGSSLLWFSQKGQLVETTPVSSILSSVPLSSLRDVLLSGDRLYVLTPHHVVVMKKIPR